MKERVLGTGATGSVRLAICRRTGRKVAVKSFKLKDLTERQTGNLKREVEVHLAASHPKILKLEAVYQTEEQIFMTLEMLEGGELFERLARCGRFSEIDAASVTVQLLHAVAYLHAQGITHRDIKPENVMYEKRKGQERGDQVKLIDFGFACRFSDDEPLTQRCGTIQYVAPEVLEGKGYNEKADMWSLGATTYALLTLKAMYSGNDSDIARKNRAGAVDFSRTFWTLSDNAQDFVQKLLAVDPAKRPTPVEALSHPWLQELVGAEARAVITDVAEPQRRSSSRRLVLTPLPPVRPGADTPNKAGGASTTSAATASTATPCSTLSEAIVEEFQHDETTAPPPTCFAAIERSWQRRTQSEVSPKAAMGFQDLAMSALARIGFIWPSQQLLAANCM